MLSEIDYHLYVLKLISENTKVLQIIRNLTFSKLSEFGDRVEITREALLQAFHHEILENRGSQYSGALGGVRYPIDKHSWSRFGLVVGENMFGEKPEQIIMGSLYAHAQFSFFIGFVGETIAKQEKQSSDTIESVQQEKVPEKPKKEKQYGGFWLALLIFPGSFFILIFVILGFNNLGENKSSVEYSKPNISTEQVEDEVGYNQDSYEGKASLEAAEPEQPIEKETSKPIEERLREIAYSVKPKEESTPDSINVSSVDYICNLYSENTFAVSKEYGNKRIEFSGKIEKIGIPSYSPAEKIARLTRVEGCKHDALLFLDSNFRTEKTSRDPELWRKLLGWYGVAVVCKCNDQENTNMLGDVSIGRNLIINGLFGSVDLDYRASEDRIASCLVSLRSCHFKIE